MSNDRVNHSLVVEYEPIPDYGDVFTAQEFEATVKDGGSIDYDGHGYYATADRMTNQRAVPSRIKEHGLLPGWTHVVWFNK